MDKKNVYPMILAFLFFGFGLINFTKMFVNMFIASTNSRWGIQGIFDDRNKLVELIVLSAIGILWLIAAELIWEKHRQRKLIAVLCAIPVPIVVAY